MKKIELNTGKNVFHKKRVKIIIYIVCVVYFTFFFIWFGLVWWMGREMNFYQKIEFKYDATMEKDMHMGNSICIIIIIYKMEQTVCV